MATTKKTLADFRASHDRAFVIPQKIKAGLEKLGKDGWEYELIFAREYAGISGNDMAQFRDQVEDFCLTLKTTKSNGGGKRVVCGSKALADKLREMV